jgi:hypothetical protein
MKKIFIIIFILFAVSQINAFNTVMFGEHKQSVSISIGTDLSLVTLKFNYIRLFDIPELSRDPVFDTGISIPLFSPDLRDFRIHAGIKLDTVTAGNFIIPASLNLIFRGHSNAAYNSHGFGLEIGLFPGYYNDKFTAAGEIIWDTQFLTHIKCSDYYKESIYQDASSGWYGFTSNMFRFGARTGFLFNDRDEISLRGGYEYHGKYNLKIPPFYAVISNSVRF